MSEVAAVEVCQVFGVDEQQLTRWGYRGYLRASRNGSYGLAELNTFLERYSKKGLFTWGKLRRNEDLLLDQESAERHFNLTAGQLSLMVARFPVTHAHFPGKLRRYSAVGLKWAIVNACDGAITASHAARATGYDDVLALRKAQGLVFAPSGVSRRRDAATVSGPSFWRYLREHLPPWIDAFEWFNDCTVAAQPLMPADQVAVFLRIPLHQLHGELHERRAAYIAKRNSNRAATVMVSPTWVWNQLGSDVLLYDDQVAKLLGVTSQAANYWRRSRRQICPHWLHEHDAQGYLWRSCWLEYLVRNCSLQLVRHMNLFVAERLAAFDPPPLMSTGQIRRAYGHSEQWLRQRIVGGGLPAIVTPGGEYRIAESWLRQAGL